MEKIVISDRLEYLAKTFDVFDCEKSKLKEKLSELKKEGFNNINTIKTSDDKKILGLISSKQQYHGGVDTAAEFNQDINIFINSKDNKISICIDVFTTMAEADPTDHKMFLQWMLNIFSKLLKEDTQKAIRFASEDLPQAKEYLTLFEAHKRKKKFKELAKASYTLKDVQDVTDINQYKSLAQLFDAVDPFIERNVSELESLLQAFVNRGQAIIPVKDRKFTLYIPKTKDASVVFEKFAGWCTAKAGQTNFKSYTEGHKKPNGQNSDLYIIINNKLFEGKSDEIVQIHFETNQIHDKSNSSVSIFEPIISQSEALASFFYNELMAMAKENKKGFDDNKYLDYLIKFGFCESLFEFLDEDTKTIRFTTREIPRMPDISKFKSLDQLIILDAKMTELHPSIGNLKNLEVISLFGENSTKNKITKLPKEIGNLKKLNFLNLIGNPLVDIPEEIKYLDRSNGGSLELISIRESDIGENNFKRIKELLPTTTINS